MYHTIINHGVRYSKSQYIISIPCNTLYNTTDIATTRYIHYTASHYHNKSSFSELQSLPLHNELYISAINKSNKINIKKYNKSMKQYHIELYSRKIKVVHDILYKRLLTAVNKFPDINNIHIFERNIIELSINTNHNHINNMSRYNGLQKYNDMIDSCKRLCNRLLSLYQQHYNIISKHTNQANIQLLYNTAIDEYYKLWYHQQTIHIIDDIKYLTKTVYNLPVLNPDLPTVTLVGLPNTGKSSIVKSISTAKPTIQNYSFTTRGIIVGHIYTGKNDILRQSYDIQITDTPGLLPRSDDERKNIELLTLSVLKYMNNIKPLVLYIIDLSQHCGYTIQQQLMVRHELYARYSDTVQFIDIYSKYDIDIDSVQINTQHTFDYTYIQQYDTTLDTNNQLPLPSNAIPVSVATGYNIDKLKQAIIDYMTPKLLQYHQDHIPLVPDDDNQSQFIVPY